MQSSDASELEKNTGSPFSSQEQEVLKKIVGNPPSPPQKTANENIVSATGHADSSASGGNANKNIDKPVSKIKYLTQVSNLGELETFKKDIKQENGTDALNNILLEVSDVNEKPVLNKLIQRYPSNCYISKQFEKVFYNQQKKLAFLKAMIMNNR